MELVSECLSDDLRKDLDSSAPWSAEKLHGKLPAVTPKMWVKP